MAFSDFDLRTVLERFDLTEVRDADLFAGVAPLEPTEFVRVWLDEFAPVALGVNTEKARSVFIIAPLLAEARRRAGAEANVLPGVMLDVDRRSITSAKPTRSSATSFTSWPKAEGYKRGSRHGKRGRYPITPFTPPSQTP